MLKGKTILTDQKAESRSADLPAFLTPPEGAPAYHGFPLIEATRTDGWCYGAITEFEGRRGHKWGDGFVVAPDGSRAGLVWAGGKFKTRELCAPDEKRWGVYEVAFPKPPRTVDDLIECFHFVLPDLQGIYARLRQPEQKPE